MYSAKVRRNETIGGLASRFLERVFDGTMGEYSVHALNARCLNMEELDPLEAMIAEAKRKRSEKTDA